MIIRKETFEDIDTITEVTIAAFRGHLISSQTEHFIFQALRHEDVLRLYKPAEIEGTVVGYIASSPVTIYGGKEN